MEWFILGCITLYVLFKFTPAKVEAALLERQRSVILKQGQQIDKLVNAWDTIFQFKRFELGLELVKGGKATLTAHHKDPALQAEAQAELDELQRLLDEIRTGKDCENMN